MHSHYASFNQKATKILSASIWLKLLKLCIMLKIEDLDTNDHIPSFSLHSFKMFTKSHCYQWTWGCSSNVIVLTCASHSVTDKRQHHSTSWLLKAVLPITAENKLYQTISIVNGGRVDLKNKSSWASLKELLWSSTCRRINFPEKKYFRTVIATHRYLFSASIYGMWLNQQMG